MLISAWLNRVTDKLIWWGWLFNLNGSHLIDRSAVVIPNIIWCHWYCTYITNLTPNHNISHQLKFNLNYQFKWFFISICSGQSNNLLGVVCFLFPFSYFGALTLHLIYIPIDLERYQSYIIKIEYNSNPHIWSILLVLNKEDFQWTNIWKNELC